MDILGANSKSWELKNEGKRKMGICGAALENISNYAIKFEERAIFKSHPSKIVYNLVSVQQGNFLKIQFFSHEVLKIRD